MVSYMGMVSHYNRCCLKKGVGERPFLIIKLKLPWRKMLDRKMFRKSLEGCIYGLLFKAKKYVVCLTIDNDGSSYNHNALENEDAGGRIAYRASLQPSGMHHGAENILGGRQRMHAGVANSHPFHEGHVACRGWCFARIRQYQEAIAEY